MLSLDQLKNLFIEQLDYTEDHDSILQPANSEQLNILRETAKNVTTINQLGSLLMVPRVNSNAGFKPIKPFDKDALYYTPFQFHRAPLDWFFMYGNCDSFAYTFIIFAVSVCNPSIADKYNLSGNQTCLYNLSGGYGIKGGPWITVPYMFCQAEYNIMTQSTLSWKGVFNNNSPILNASFEALSVGNFSININWKNGSDIVGISSTLSSTQGPFLNGPQGCDPCIAGVGTSYYSYTDMNVVAEVGIQNNIKGTGTGWFDHQWLQMGKFHDNITLAALSNVINYFKTPVVTRWFWLSIQDKVNNVQYNTVVMPSDILNENDSPEFSSTATIKYTQIGGPIYLSKSKTTVKVLESVSINGTFLPTKHLVTIRDGDDSVTYIMKAEFGNSIVYLPSGNMNWEGSGTLYDETGINILGKCFLEANQMESEENLLKTVCSNAGIKDDYKIFSLKNSKVSGLVFFISLIWLIFCLIICIFILYLVYKLIKTGIKCYKKIE